MKNEIQIFNNPQFGEIRTATNEAGEPLFCLIDICTALKLSNSSSVAQKLDDEDKAKLNLGLPGQQPIFVTEPGMYTVILRSDSPLAKPMQKWVTSEILPTIRKTGGYIATTEQDTPELIMARALIVAQEAIKRSSMRLSVVEAEKELYKCISDDQSRELKLTAPKVEYHDDFLSSQGLLTVNNIAMALGMSAISLNKWLCAKNIQYKCNGTFVLYADYRHFDLAKPIPHPYTNSEGKQTSKDHLYWTEKGKNFIIRFHNTGVVPKDFRPSAIKTQKA